MASHATAPAGQIRKKRLPPPVSDLDGVDRASWLLCRAGPHLCALPTDRVIEIMRVLPLDPFPAAPRYVRGLSIIRGVPVPVVDVGLIVGDQPIRATRLVAIRAGTRTIALAMESVLGIDAIGTDAAGQMPPLLREAASEAVAAIGILDAELLFFLRTARMVPEDVLDRIGAAGDAL
jgi:purine-binding chemotaxis protein CheW